MRVIDLVIDSTTLPNNPFYKFFQQIKLIIDAKYQGKI